MNHLPTLVPLDWALLAVLALSVLVGLWRGLVFELMSLAGWVLAWMVARTWAADVAVWLPVGAADSVLRLGAAYALSFMLTLLLCAVLARLVRGLIAATPLSGIDRLLGAGFGLARGLMVLLVAATLLMWTPAPKSAWWQASKGAVWLESMLRVLRPMLTEPTVSFVFFPHCRNGLHPCAASSA